ncbi:MAG: DUF423 domain-containing protein [Weeksellaceae bacterium]|nr:DUF423 domain-containing protein [Weeksellaceae bacterium]
MKKLVLATASVYGMFSVILGAFGAHLFKEYLDEGKLASFETGVRYQMYNAIALLVLGLCLKFETAYEKNAAGCLMIGSFLFSVSIYFLSFSEHWGVNLKFLGPVTPLGGLLMIIGWFLLLIFFIKKYKTQKV